MTLPAVGEASYPTPSEIRDQILSDIAYGFAKNGLTANVLPGSDNYIRADAISKRIAVAIANNSASLEDLSPLTATGDALVTLAGVFGVSPREPSSASGYVTIKCTGTVTIPASFQATAPDGQKYQTPSAGTYTTGAKVQVTATGTGTATNQDAGTVLTWDSASIGALTQQATVDAGGLDGGADTDDDETLRQRFIRRLSFPSVGGNVAQVAGWAEESTAAVQAAYVYAAARGPGSYDVAVTADSTDRTLSSANVNTVAGYILGQMPGHPDLNVTSVTAQEVDVILHASLPLPTNAGGAGGGWRDATPWPSSADAVGLGKITAVSGNVITVNSTSADPPVMGRHFAVWDYDGETMAEFRIASVGGASGAYTVTIDTANSDSYSFLEVGMYCSAGAFNIGDYASTFLAQVQALGPGEKTSDANILPRGRRQPSPDVEAPSDLTLAQLSALKSAHAEILDLSYAARYATGTTTTRSSPTVPSTAADPPNILTLKHFAIRKA